MAGDNIFWYEGPVTQGERVSGLTYEQAMELQKQEDEMKKQQASDAQLGPQISAGIRAYETQQKQGTQGQPNAQMFQNDSPMAGMGGGGMPQQQQAQAQQPNVSVFRFGDDGFMQNISSAVQEQQRETPSPFEGTPATDSLYSNLSGGNSMMSGMSDSASASYPGFTDQQMAKERQMSGPMMSIMKDVPPEIAQDLIARYRMGDLKPSAFIKEVTAIKKTLFDDKKDRESKEFSSKLKINEDTNKENFTNQRNYDDIESREKMNREDNQTSLAVAGMRQRNEFESARQQRNALSAAEFDNKTKERLIAVEEGKYLLTELVTTFKGSNFGNASDAIGQGAAKIPFAGKFVAGKNKEYQNQKKLAAETWLRAATGAAAPPAEVQTYANFLPDESDPPEIADKKTANFFNKVSAKAAGNASVLRLEGKGLEKNSMIDLANIKYEQANLIEGMIDNARASIPAIAEKKTDDGTGQVSPGAGEAGTSSASKYLEEIRARRAVLQNGR